MSHRFGELDGREGGYGGDLATDLSLLQEHRAGIELLRLALFDAATPYATVIEAVCALIPGPSPSDVQATKAMARTGPPREQGGLELGSVRHSSHRRAAMSWLDILLWGIATYFMVVVLVGGAIWRYRYEKFGWTTRSSELYESRLLRIGSLLFHFGLLVVIIGHVMGLIIPKSLTDTVGLSQDAYHVQALVLGSIAGFLTLVGIGEVPPVARRLSIMVR